MSMANMSRVGLYFSVVSEVRGKDNDESTIQYE